MSFLDGLFTSREELEKQQAAAKRRAIRTVENSIDQLSERSGELARDQQKYWERAKDALKKGQKTEAQRQLTIYESKGRSKQRFDNQRTIFQDQLDSLIMANELKDATSTMGNLLRQSNVSPEAIASMFDEINDQNANIADANKIFDKNAQREFSRENSNLAAPECNEELMNALAAEAAAELENEMAGPANNARINATQQGTIQNRTMF